MNDKTAVFMNALEEVAKILDEAAAQVDEIGRACVKSAFSNVGEGKEEAKGYTMTAMAATALVSCVSTKTEGLAKSVREFTKDAFGKIAAATMTGDIDAANAAMREAKANLEARKAALRDDEEAGKEGGNNE